MKKKVQDRTQDLEFANELIERSKILAGYLDSIEGIYRSREDFDLNYPFAAIRDMLNCCAWAYPVVSREIKTADVDRMSAMLIGPLFTSDRHPWPRKDRRFLEPLIQFDLEWVGNVGNVNLGSGILQLWLDSSRSIESVCPEFRVIPKEDFIPEMLSPIPKTINRRYFKDKSLFAGDEDSWLDRKNNGQSVIITGLGPPTITWHRSLRDSLYFLAYDSMADENVTPIVEFLEFLPTTSRPPTPHFFGNCDPIQYDPEDLGLCLLALESRGPYIWGDSGNAQIGYGRRADGSVWFHFAWSCH